MQTETTPQINQQDENLVRLLYEGLLDNWNEMDAANYAKLFTDDANIIGFDGSQMNGRQEIYDQISGIFASHKVASYVHIIKEVRSLGATVVLLRAVAGMVPPGQSGIKPDVNAIQTLIAVKQQEQFRIAVFQNTPAAFHGRPELSNQLTEELQEVLREKSA